MIRKIQSIHWYWFHACYRNLTLLFSSKHVNAIYKPITWVCIWIFDSNQLHLIWLLVALAQITAYCHVMIMHHIVHCIDCVLPCLSPLDRRRSDDEFDDTDEELYYLWKCQASKTSLFIPIQSHSLAPALFYCIRTISIQLLHGAVVEPLSSAWPVFAIVNSWNPLAWVGVAWALMCLLIHACFSYAIYA